MMLHGGDSINLAEFGPAIMEQLLTFMYTGLVDVSAMTPETIGTLLSAAGHYQEIIIFNKTGALRGGGGAGHFTKTTEPRIF